MKTLTHVLINAIAGLGLYAAGSFSALDIAVFVLGGVLIDIDHIIYHILAEKNLSIKDFMRIHTELFRTMTPKFYFFHTFEVIALSIAFAIFHPITRVFVMGYMLHICCDIIKYLYIYKNVSWAKHWVLMWYLRRSKNRS